MIPVLYPANATDFSSFGLGVLTDTISCEVTEERNGVFECLFKYPVSGQHYGLITKECIIKAKPNDTAADQAFRIYRITKPLNGIVTIYGQHISYDLANVPVQPVTSVKRRCGRPLSTAHSLAAPYRRYTLYGLDRLLGCKGVFRHAAEKCPSLPWRHGRFHALQMVW